MPTPTELFEKLCKAWDVEMSPIGQDEKNFKFRRELTYHGQPLDVVWSPETAEDLRAFHGIEAEAEIVRVLVDQLIIALLKVKEDEEVAVAS